MKQENPDDMTFYARQVLDIREACFPDRALCLQVIAAKKYMDQRFPEPLTLEKIAREACYSRFHFLRLFKALYGITPHHYLTGVRIRKAKQLLASGISTSRVCYAVGFDSISSFKGLFKRYTALTPYAYQQQVNKKSISCFQNASQS